MYRPCKTDSWIERYSISNKFKTFQDNRYLPGAGSTEIELAKQIASYGEVIYIAINGNIIYFSVPEYLKLIYLTINN